MPNKQIFTENPENDLWQELMQFSYKANVERYLEEHNLVKSEDTINTIIGSFLQANEYFDAPRPYQMKENITVPGNS